MCAADCCRCLRRDPPPRRRAAAACARRRLVDDSSRARRAAQRAARLWSESSRVEITKSANFEVARESLEMVPRRSPSAGASHLSLEGPVPPRSRAAGARGQLCVDKHGEEKFGEEAALAARRDESGPIILFRSTAASRREPTGELGAAALEFYNKTPSHDTGHPRC